MGGLRLAWRIARRELRGGLRGFGIFLACLALGVAAIGGAGSLNAAMHAALSTDARTLLGGDLALRLSHRPLAAEPRAHLDRLGRVGEGIEMRAMARPEGGTARSLVEVKGVDNAYPLYGALALEPAGADLLGRRDGRWGAAVDANLLSRLGIGLGDVVRLGELVVELRAVIRNEPDRVATALAFGPRLLLDQRALADSGLIQPGSLLRYVYWLRLPAGIDAAAVKADLLARFPRAGWQIRDVGEAAPGLGRFLDNMATFLAMVGLTALLIGGIGVANAVKAFLDGRRRTIAVLKCLGAPAPLVFRIYLLQVGVLAGLGVALGLTAAMAAPSLAGAVAAGLLPVEAKVGFYPQPLLVATAYGLLTALAFAVWPLARAAALPGAALFRDLVAPPALRLSGRPLAVVALAVLALAALAVFASENRLFALWFVGGAAAVLVLLRGAAALLRRLARAGTPRLGRLGPAWRLGLAGLYRPGAATVTVVTSLGLGLTVLVAIALTEANLWRQLAERLPAEAPAFYFIDIQKDQLATFDAAVAATSGVGAVERAAMVRGRITRLNGVPVETVAIATEAEWAVRSDRALTEAATPPRDSRLVAGTWWPADYTGPPLVSMDAGIARGFGLEVGDSVTLSVLGREITARIASLRDIDWSTLAMNFTFMLSPGTLAGAPYSYIASVAATPDAEDALERAVTDRLTNVSAIRVREAIEAVRRVVGGAAVAVRSAAAIALVAGALVLAGAIAAGHRRRVYEAVLLKVVGATRRDVARAYLVEYGLLGLATGVVAGLAGAAVAWAVLRFVMRADAQLQPAVAATTVIVCVVAVLAAGFAGTWRAMAAKAAPYLRNE